jgi:4-hydroxy-2-oxoheptanedioate aldolase
MYAGGVIGKLAQQLKTGCVYSAWIGVNDPFVAETLAREDFDAVTLDMQHGDVDLAGATRAILAIANAGKPTIVRVPLDDFATASRAADAGAAAVIAPMINSAEAAERFAEHLKFPPLGRRSWGPRTALALSGLAASDYLKAANAFTLAIAMVETREALEAVDEIMAVDGIDGVFVGPGDLSIALSHGQVLDTSSRSVNEALERIVASAKARGKFAGLYCPDGARAKYARERGVAFCTVSSDQALMCSAARQELAAARS